MKILVTGSEGSLMQAVIPKLLQQGHEILGVDNLYRHGKVSSLANKEYEFQNIDLTNRTQTSAICKNVDAVFLAAAKIYGVGGFNHYCADIVSDDIAIQSNILHSCAKNSINRIIYISSSMVYETCTQDINYPVTEDLVENCIAPKTDYGLSKYVGERMCRAFNKQYNIDYTIWRPFNIITPFEQSMPQQGFSHVFADYVDSLVTKKLNPLPIIGDGNQIRCFTWINDVANIIADYSFNAKTKNEAYNICNVEPITMRELAEKIYATTHPARPLEFKTVATYQDDVIVRIPSINKLRSIINNYQFVSVNESIARCVNAT